MAAKERKARKDEGFEGFCNGYSIFHPDIFQRSIKLGVYCILLRPTPVLRIKIAEPTWAGAERGALLRPITRFIKNTLITKLPET